MSNGVNTIQAANNGITSITKLVQSAQALISQAQQTADTTVRASLAVQFDAIRTQIDTLSADAGFNGINLLGGNNLTVTLNETGTSSVTVDGVTFTSAGLAIAASANSWAADADITAASATLTAALTTLRSQAQAFWHQPVDRADPPGLHQGDDQHAADRRGQPDARRLQRGGRQPARPADPPAAFDHRAVARLAGRQSVLRLFQ